MWVLSSTSNAPNRIQIYLSIALLFILISSVKSDMINYDWFAISGGAFLSVWCLGIFIWSLHKYFKVRFPKRAKNN